MVVRFSSQMHDVLQLSLNYTLMHLVACDLVPCLVHSGAVGNGQLAGSIGILPF